MYQKIIIVGNLGGDPQMRYMSDGTPVTNFSVATNRSWTDSSSGQRVDETTWFRVSVWRRQAEAVNQYLSKGQRVLVEGRLRPDENGGPRLWTAQDGSTRASFEITADSVQFLSTREEAAQLSGDSFDSGDDSFDQSPVEEEDDIPF